MNTCNKATSCDEEQAPLHGDVLEAILSRLPLINLLPASHVSKTWTTAITSALRTSSTTKPWLILHTQSSRYPHPTTTHAYDPESKNWIQIRQASINYVSTLRSSHSNLLYMLSPSKLSFSFDSLHLTWHNVSAPKIWRIDPVVAIVGNHVIIAGGSCDFEDDPLAVEVYDVKSQTWTKSDPMPEAFNESASSLWLSISSTGRELFLMEKCSGVTHSFNPNNNTWSGPYDLRPDPLVFYSVIGYSDNRMILIGILSQREDVDCVCVKVWEVNLELYKCEEIGEMPFEFVECLKSCDDEMITSLDIVMAGNVVYVYNNKGMGGEEIVMCELNDGCRWSKVAVVSGRSFIDRLVLTCSIVGMEELQRATREDWKFIVKR